MDLKCTVSNFDVCIHYEMITTIKLINMPIISQSYQFFCMFVFGGENTWDLLS